MPLRRVRLGTTWERWSDGYKRTSSLVQQDGCDYRGIQRFDSCRHRNAHRRGERGLHLGAYAVGLTTDNDGGPFPPVDLEERHFCLRVCRQDLIEPMQHRL